MTPRELEMIEQAKPLFAKYDQDAIISRLNLEHNENSIYICILSEKYTLNRNTYDVIDSDGNLASCSAHLCIYDAICRYDTPPIPTNKFFPVNSLGNMVHPGVEQERLLSQYAKCFEDNLDKLEKYLKSIGGIAYPVGDIAYTINLFDFLKVCIQLWRSDEEYPPTLQVLWEETTLHHLKYEVVWYACGFMLDKIKQVITEK